MTKLGGPRDSGTGFGHVWAYLRRIVLEYCGYGRVWVCMSRFDEMRLCRVVSVLGVRCDVQCAVMQRSARMFGSLCL